MMPKWLENTLFWIVVAVVMIVLAAIPFATTLWAGLGWGIVVTALLAAAVTWLAGQMGMEGLTIAIPGWIAIAVGLVGAIVWLLFGFILAVVR